MEATCSFVFKENEFYSNHWEEQMLSESETSRAMVDRIPAGGREGGPFRQHIHQWSKRGSEQQVGACMVSHTNLHAVYRPSESGSIISIDFDCTLRNIERSTETHFALLLQQNNNLYVSKNTITAKRERWSTFSMHNLKRADFKRLVPTPKENVREEFPNFTFLGGDIRLGYVTMCTTSQTQDEAVSGIDFWRVTVYHENAEATNQNMRVLQLEHNNNILLQELSDMHEHVDLTRREHAAQLSGLNNMHDECARERECAAQERAINEKLKEELEEQRQALHSAEVATHSAYAESDKLRDMINDLRVYAEEENASRLEEVEKLKYLLDEERHKNTTITRSITDTQYAVTRMEQELRIKDAELEQLRAEKAALVASRNGLERTVSNLKEENSLLVNERQHLMQANTSLSHSASETKACVVKLEGLLKLEQVRCEELDRQLAAASIQLKDELRSLSERMDSDLAKERSLRHQLESDHRKEIATTENIARMEKSRMEEEMRAERLSYLKREAELLEEKRNLATSLQSATTKGALVEQQLSNQLLSVSALRKSEVERIAQLESELKMERENRELLESTLPKDDEDWEVVEDSQ